MILPANSWPRTLIIVAVEGDSTVLRYRRGILREAVPPEVCQHSDLLLGLLETSGQTFLRGVCPDLVEEWIDFIVSVVLEDKDDAESVDSIPLDKLARILEACPSSEHPWWIQRL